MEFFGFVINVWVAIAIGVFFIAMIAGCTYDRHGTESPKWWVFSLSLLVFLIWTGSNNNWEWAGIKTILLDGHLWVLVGYYLLIGLGYSIIEFLLEVRRSARFWSERWKQHKKNDAAYKDKYEAAGRTGPTLVSDFMKSNTWVKDNHIIGIEANADDTGIEPKINRTLLAESIGCWTIWWPFYAVSLIIGDLLDEVFRAIADFVANISGRFVRLVFKDVFK